jgi:hypothetical protein
MPFQARAAHLPDGKPPIGLRRLRVQEPLTEAIQSCNSPSSAVPFDTLATLPSAPTNTSFGTPLT